MRLFVVFLFALGCNAGASVTSEDTSSLAADALKTDKKHVVVTLTPDHATIAQGEQLQLDAKVTGTTDTEVTWHASKGQIDANGLYTAPQEDGSYEVTATTSRNVVGRVTIIVGTKPSTHGTDAGVDLSDLPRTCHRDGESLMRVTVRIDSYLGTQTGRNGVHELVEGTVTEFAYNETPSVVDTSEVHVAMNVASDTDSQGLPREIPLQSGSVVEIQGVYIPNSATDTLDMAVLHFTHSPCGYVTIDGQTYQ